MGISRGNPSEYRRLVDLSDNLRVAVRADRPGRRMVDFHTVQAEKMMRADGSIDSKDPTIISRRSYLQDASFAVFLSGPDNVLSACAEALQHPVWPPYLGRKSCVPSRPIFAGESDEYDSLRQAAESVLFPKTRRAGNPYRRWIEVDGNLPPASEEARAALKRQDRLMAAGENTRQFSWGSYVEDTVRFEGGQN
jgi:CRISPR system Cascade subunit CasD